MQKVSDSMMMMLGKLAQHAVSEGGDLAAAADTALRENVERLISDWDLEDPNPEAYSSALQHMARNPRHQGLPAPAGQDDQLDPEQLVRIGLEVGEVGPRVHLAAERLVADGRTSVLTELLDGAAKAGIPTEAIWARVSLPELLAQELGNKPVDFGVVESLVARLKGAASEPLLDALAASDDRSARWNLLRILGEVGAPAAPAVAARLPDTPWFVQRNLLILMGRLGPWPEGFSPMPYVSHPEPRVRREALRLLLDSPDTREAGIVMGLTDPDSGILTIVLGAVLTGCPSSTFPHLDRIVHDPSRESGVRLLAVRAMAACPHPERVSRLVALVRRRRWWGGVRLMPKSPILLAALKALAENHPGHPDASSLLALAARHRDPEIRATVGRPAGPVEVR
jgi:HEAT repeat protein